MDALLALKDKVVAFCMESGLKLIIAIVVLLIGFKIIDIFGKKFKDTKFYEKLDPTARTFFRSFIVIALKIVLVIAAALIVGIPMASMVAVIGSAGLAIGLALQGSLSNIAGGFIILVFKPFKVGDFIETADAMGTVEAINIFYTKILTVDNKVIQVPNAVISNQRLTDYSTKDTRRVDLTINASYNNDIEKVKSVLLSVAEKTDKALLTPAPQARVCEHGSNSIGFVFRVWCKTDDYWDVYFNLLEGVKKAFDENNIQIPYQQIDVHVDNK
ncbi:MAG: mechanosensitive ion channel [Clostridia bacterium]|nr:mechanosensitive ion channel [Clostridia bacterium]